MRVVERTKKYKNQNANIKPVWQESCARGGWGVGEGGQGAERLCDWWMAVIWGIMMVCRDAVVSFAARMCHGSGFWIVVYYCQSLRCLSNKRRLVQPHTTDAPIAVLGQSEKGA